MWSNEHKVTSVEGLQNLDGCVWIYFQLDNLAQETPLRAIQVFYNYRN